MTDDEPPVLATRLEGLHVLVVEDYADALELLQLSLELQGARVTPAPTVADALAAIRADRPDVIVTDINMPGEDGFDLMEQVSALENPPPAIAITALASPDEREQILHAGFKAHVGKPADLASLISVIAGLTGRL